MRPLIQSPHIRHTTIILNLARKVLFDAKVSISPKMRNKNKKTKDKIKQNKRRQKKKEEKDNIPENTNVIVLPVDPSLLLPRNTNSVSSGSFAACLIRMRVSECIHCIGCDKRGEGKREREIGCLPRLLWGMRRRRRIGMGGGWRRRSLLSWVGLD